MGDTAGAEDAPGMSVLVVEQEPGLRHCYRDWLEDAGLAVAEAATMEQAQQLVGELRPRVVVADLLLDRDAGTGLCRTIRLHPGCRSTSIICLTSVGGEATRAALRQVGADLVLVQPLTQSQLTATCLEAGRRRPLRK
jgi:DNA-binding response OmpR family regulator